MVDQCNLNVVASFLMCTNTFDTKFQNAVYSCLNQSIKNIELIIVANGLDEQNKTKMISYCTDPRIVLLFSPLRHLTANLNLGLLHCRSNYVARMDADDISHPRRVEQQIKLLDQNNSVVICGSSYRLIDNEGEIVGSVIAPKAHKRIVRKLFFTNPISHPTVMFRKDIILKLGGYLGGKYAQDYDLWLRVARETNYEFRNLDEFLLDYRVTGAGARRSKEAYANVSMVQWRQFLLTSNPIWFAASLLFFAKAIFR